MYEQGMKQESTIEFVGRLKDLYPEYPLPGEGEYEACVGSLEYISFASPAVEFCEYVHARRLSWFDCSWEKDLLPLEEDTTIMPDYIFASPFLRYYFPMCLHVCVRFFMGDYEAGEFGNVDSFVEHTLNSMIDHTSCLAPEERELLVQFCLLMEGSECHDYLQYPYLRRVVDKDAPQLKRGDFEPNRKRVPSV